MYIFRIYFALIHIIIKYVTEQRPICFRALTSHAPPRPQAPKMLARWNYKLGRVERAIDCVRDHVSLHPLQSDPTHVNILAELYMEKVRAGKRFFLKNFGGKKYMIYVIWKSQKLNHKYSNKKKGATISQLVNGQPNESNTIHRVMNLPLPIPLLPSSLLPSSLPPQGMYAECIQLITADASLVPGMEGGLPVDLSVKAGVCAVKLGRIDEGKQYFEDLNYQVQ